MPPKPAPSPASSLIAGSYAVDVSHPLSGAGGGLPAFAVVDHRAGRAGLMAVQSEQSAPPRAGVLGVFGDWASNGLLVPLALGPARGAHNEAALFVISAAPPGPSLAAALRQWSEPELLERVLRPAASVLLGLEERRVTHRAIRLDNIFQGGRNAPAVLGAAWSAPPARYQPAIYEPAYSAMCLAAGHGEGSIADDVYALGVVLAALAMGRVPLEGMEPAAIIRRKLELGSFAALVGDERLPPAINDLVRGMLAEDPDHRPPPSLLVDPAAARARRVAARPPRRAPRPLELTGGEVWNARALAYAMACAPDLSPRLLRSGAADRWLRRNLGDPVAATKLEEVLHLRSLDGPSDDARADGLMVMRAVASLDPLAPLCWRGIALWPDGLGPALAAARTDSPPAGKDAIPLAERLAELIDCEAASHWAQARPDRSDPTILRAEARHHRMLLRQRGWVGGLPRLTYAQNPLLPCTSPLLAGAVAVRTPELLTALNAVASSDQARRSLPIDREIAAFIAARADQNGSGDTSGLDSSNPADQAPLLQLRVLAELQRRSNGTALPGLAGWLMEQLAPTLGAWHNRQRREGLQHALQELATAGNLAAMAALLDNPEARRLDEQGHQAAVATVQRIDAELRALTEGKPRRAESARQTGHELTLGLAMMALTAAVVAMALS